MNNENAIQDMINANNAMDRLRKYNMNTQLKSVFSQDEHTTFSKLSPVGKRKMLRRMEGNILLKKMSYAQARLFHRLKGRIK